MARCDRANPDSRNFGLGSRDMGYAGRSALREGMQSHSSIATMADRWGQFASWAREEAGIRDMRHIETATLRGALPDAAPALSVDELNALKPEAFFERLYRHRYGSDAPPELMAAFGELLATSAEEGAA